MEEDEEPLVVDSDDVDNDDALDAEFRRNRLQKVFVTLVVIFLIVLIGSVVLKLAVFNKIDNSSNCSSEWKKWNSYCYKKIESKLKWFQAEKDCQIHGGHLVSVHSDEEMRFLMQISNFHDKDFDGGLWLGLLRRSSVWSDGTTVSFTKFASEERIHGQLDCVLYYPYKIDEKIGQYQSRWKHVNCSLEHGYICKKRIRK